MLFEDLVEISRQARQYAFSHLHYEVLSLNSYQALHLIDVHEHCNQEDLAAALHMDKGNLTRLLVKLEKGNLICRMRNPADKRSLSLSLTEQGHVVLDDFSHMIDLWSEQALSALQPEERAQLFDMLERIQQKSC